MRRLLLAALGFAVLFLAFGTPAAVLYTDFLWFNEVGYSTVWVTQLTTRIILGLVTGIIAAVFLWGNLALTWREFALATVRLDAGAFMRGVTTRRFRPVVSALSLMFGLAVGLSSHGQWMELQRFLNASEFGLADPILGVDAGFYLFKLTFLEWAYHLGMTVLVATGVAVAAAYLVTKSLELRRGVRGVRVFTTPRARYHLSTLVALGFLLKAWGYRLSMYNLMYSPRGVVFGASYTDVHGQLVALKVLMVLAVVCAVLVLTGIFARTGRLILGGVFALLIGSVVLGTAYPAIIQRFYVEPNELAAERPFIEHNIAFTRAAYGLDNVENRDFTISGKLDAAEVQSRAASIANVRLWDWKPLLQTYSQLQEIRLYYEFSDVDIDRYETPDGTRMVMLAARELNVEELPSQAQTWINRHLKYTHGYGVVMSPVNEVTSEGLPELWVRDIPPVSSVKGIEIARPEIYFGERTDYYAVVNTREKEFDYPVGDQNAYTTYEGSGGVKIGGFLRRIAFALRFGSSKFIFSSAITPESRVLFNRNIHDRVRLVAPFLVYDSDPYLVVDSAGKLYWIYDAYTVSNRFPYAEPYSFAGRRINYIRNSVKVVIDAYDGDMKFYVFDDRDPLIRAYAGIFKGMFTPAEEMPEDLKAHIRYPQDLLELQAAVYAAYHMDDPDVFYNKEDSWDLAREIYAGEETRVEPYYVYMTLPGEQDTGFLLTMPFTPLRKDNMIAWLAARCDPEGFGQLVCYRFSKQRTVYGPMQIEAQIDQDSEISKLLTLWSQKGSRVIRGNLLVIPLESTVLYVEPLFLAAEQSELPQLKMVTVSDGTEVYMAPTFAQALAALTGTGRTVAESTRPEAAPEAQDVQDIRSLIRRAGELYDRAQERIAVGDWSGYGDAVEELGRVLDQLEVAAGR